MDKRTYLDENKKGIAEAIPTFKVKGWKNVKCRVPHT